MAEADSICKHFRTARIGLENRCLPKGFHYSSAIDMDTAIALSLVLIIVGLKFASDATKLLKNGSFRAVEQRDAIAGTSAPLTKSDQCLALLVFGIGLYCLAPMEYFRPEHPPFYGRLSWLRSLLFNGLGDHGLVLVPVILGTILLYLSARPPEQ